MSGPIRSRLRHLPSGLIASAVLLGPAVVLGAMTVGSAGALGAVAGVALVAASYSGSSLVIAWADSVSPTLVMPVGLVTYTVKFTLLGMGMFALNGWAGLVPMALAIAATALTWTVAQAWWTWHARIPYVELQ